MSTQGQSPQATADKPTATGSGQTATSVAGAGCAPATPPSLPVLAMRLCTRLCHDLAGPINAVTTGAELLEDEAGHQGGGASTLDPETLALLADSARLAAARLTLLRLATGVVKGRHPTLADVGRATHGAFAPLGREVVLSVAPDHEPGAAGARLLLVLILVAADFWPRAARLIVDSTATDAGVVYRIRTPGGGGIDPAFAAGLLGPDAAPDPAAAADEAQDREGGEGGSDPRTVFAEFARLLVADLGATLRLGETGDQGLSLCLPLSSHAGVADPVPPGGAAAPAVPPAG